MEFTAPTLPDLVDLACIALVALLALVGASRGALRGVLRLLSIVVAVGVGRIGGVALGPPLAPVLGVPKEGAGLAAAIVVAAVVLVALGFLLQRNDERLRALRIPWLDPILGLVLGLGLGVALVVVTGLGLRAAASPDSALIRAVEASRAAALARSVTGDAPLGDRVEAAGEPR